MCQIFQTVRGRKPNSNATLSAMGVDSLGAIMFIRFLSDSVGGIKITPAEVYSSGVTIKSFSDVLHRRLIKENPAALRKLGLSDTASAFDAEATSLLEDGLANNNISNNVRGSHGESSSFTKQRDQGGFDATGNNEDDYEEPDNAAADFDELVAANRSVFEGLRGVFTFMVLYDHFHNPLSQMSAGVQADTSLFIIISGVTTALQVSPSLAVIFTFIILHYLIVLSAIFTKLRLLSFESLLHESRIYPSSSLFQILDGKTFSYLEQ